MLEVLGESRVGYDFDNSFNREISDDAISPLSLVELRICGKLSVAFTMNSPGLYFMIMS